MSSRPRRNQSLIRHRSNTHTTASPEPAALLPGVTGFSSELRQNKGPGTPKRNLYGTPKGQNGRRMQEQAAKLQSCRCLGSRQLVAPSCRRSKLRSWDAEPESLTAPPPPPPKKSKKHYCVLLYMTQRHTWILLFWLYHSLLLLCQTVICELLHNR